MAVEATSRPVGKVSVPRIPSFLGETVQRTPTFSAVTLTTFSGEAWEPEEGQKAPSPCCQDFLGMFSTCRS